MPIVPRAAPVVSKCNSKVVTFFKGEHILDATSAGTVLFNIVNTKSKHFR